MRASVVDSNAFSWYSQMLASVGRLEEARDMALAAEIIDPDSPVVNSRIAMVYTWLDDPEYATEGLAAINRAWAEHQVIPHIVLLARTLLGDIDGAMEIAWLANEPGETFSMEILFISELAPPRQHPGFMPLLDELGVVDHWHKAGCRWQNDRVACSS